MGTLLNKKIIDWYPPLVVVQIAASRPNIIQFLANLLGSMYHH